MNINLYKKRRLRNTQAILTRHQIKDIGHILGYKSFRQSVEFLMDPYNYFKLSKVKMAEIHQYLLDKNITLEKCPNTHIRQTDHSRLLIHILFPGYPIIKASELHYRDLRENRSPQAKSLDLAYDQLPTTDKYERLDELFRTEVNWSRAVEFKLDIPLKNLNRSIVTEGHATSKLNVRLFLYLWTSEHMSWTPQDIDLYVNHDKVNCLTESDKETHRFGFKHIDITDKSDLIKKANRRSTGSITFEFIFNGKRPTIHHASVCAVIQKSPEELASQLYVQTASLYIGRAMEKSSRNIPLAQQVQQKAIPILNQYNVNDRLELDKTQTLFTSCADAFIEYWKDDETDEKGDDEVEVYTGDEIISMLDPISLEKIKHPARCIFCKHNTCFDVAVFFKFQVTSMHWKCPLCYVKIRGIQDLYIDYHLKKAIMQYPNEERLLRSNQDDYSIVQLPKEEDNPIQKRPIEVISILDESNNKKLKT